MSVDAGGAVAGGVAALVVGALLFAGWRFSRGRVRADGGTRSLPGRRVRAALPFDPLRWLTTVNHRDIGVLYISFAFVAAMWGGTDAMMIRTELLTPGATVWSEQTYNALFTTHGLTMLFFFVTPAFTGMANYFVPILVGADDMAFPRANALGFWLLPPALVLVRAGLITEVAAKVLAAVQTYAGLQSAALARLTAVLFALEPPATGWTIYTPLATTLENPQVDLMLLGLHLSGIATVVGAVNIIVTVFEERAPEVSWADLDILTWTLVTMAGIILFAFPLLGSALVMLLMDRNFGTTFFAVEGGGPILWQHLFWFFGHPEVYILVLPAFGLVSYILPKFSGRKLFGFRFIVYSTLALGVLSFGVWAHHMFATGIDPRLRASFMAVSIAIAVPSAVKTFNWMTTMWRGRVRLTAPMILCIGGVGLFVIGGVTGVFLASIPVDLVLHDTYYVVGHFHFIVMGVITMAAFAACYFWFPLITGRRFDRRLARVQAYTLIVGVFVTFFPMLLLGYDGMPRRYASYAPYVDVNPEWLPLQWIATFGAAIIGVSVALWLLNMVRSLRMGPYVTDADVWDLKRSGQFTREWAWFERKLDDRLDEPTAQLREDDDGDHPADE
ncbi:cbb3-type cytochrome c oxidase subunit I [Candidatus Halobonum tyrrellensis]|uniref:Cytochrome c oxidase subunit I n=1 Tax=Candidatus Halobonum tyrrellensis G22 TaxID=1324957 RepID=V4HM24_9EURY|nr:cbb3-type cytochrome c oxidase subunit I [Candidatus Halobonum tyrrellensis]ESP88979.1 cytochrome c oxidase subunit I [Candidatus Halobonum tyrrellensis G22]